MRLVLAALLLGGLLLAAWLGAVVGERECAAQGPVSIGVDADPTGNTATSLGPIDSCISVSNGDTFQIDLFVSDVDDLLAWEAYFTYDMNIVNILDRDVMMFQTANPGSNVFDVSEDLPDIDGRYGVAAADIAQPIAPDSGSGVLARLTLKAVGAGVSPASLSPIDVNGDGRMDLGPWLKDSEGAPIADGDGDGFFDGSIANAQIAVDKACLPVTPGPSPTPRPAASPTPEATPGQTPTPALTPAVSPTPSASPTAATPTASPAPGTPTAGEETEGEGGPPWVIAYAAGGAVGALLLGSAAWLAIRRQRRP